MKIALISDIHGNGVALDAALDDIERQQVDQIICLGDVVEFGPQPVEATRRVQALNCPVIMGNTDDWILNGFPGDIPQGLDESDTIFHWCAAQLSEDDLRFLRTFQATLSFTIGSKNGLCFHGSPRSNREKIVASTPDTELEPMFAGCEATILIGGHTHLQLQRRWQDRIILNPGSIGVPLAREVNSGEPRRYHPQAEYAILSDQNGVFSIEFRQVPYALNILREITLGSGMPYAEWWIGNWDRAT